VAAQTYPNALKMLSQTFLETSINLRHVLLHGWKEEPKGCSELPSPSANNVSVMLNQLVFD